MKKVLLDNCVPERLVSHLLEFEASHSLVHGWETLANGVLLAQAEASGFEALLTVDKGIAYQKSMKGRTISVVLVRSFDTQLDVLIQNVAKIAEGLHSVEPGRLLVVDLREYLPRD